MRKRESERIQKLWDNRDNSETDLKKSVAACKKYCGCAIIGKDEKSEKCGSCEGLQKEICDYLISVKPVKRLRSERPWDLIVDNLWNDIPRKEIAAKCVELGMSESAAKDFVSSAGCVVNTIRGKNKKDGLVSRYIAWLRKGQKGDAPQGSKNLIYYCKRVWATCMANDDIAVTIVNK